MSTAIPVSDLEDALVVERALGGSQDAYRELVRRYQRPVFNLVVRLVGRRADAEDLTQESLVKAFRALPRYDPARRFSSWIFRIAHNHAIDHLRRRGPAGAIDTGPAPEGLASGAPSPADLAERTNLADAVRVALAGLRAEYRTAVTLRYQEGLSCEEIAHVMDAPEGTIKTYLHRARKALGEQLRGQGWEDPG